jgi:ABC-type multidrug transport system fused ATPase/permease subunit
METTQSRIAALQRQIERIERRINALQMLNSRNRMLSFIIIIAGLFCIFFGMAYLGLLGIVILAMIAFIIYRLMQMAPRISNTLLQFQAWQRLLNYQIARLQLDWNAMPLVPPRDEQEEESHPFETDLDISGERSLHRLLNTGVSWEGTLRLRDSLLTREPDYDEIYARQALVRELIPLKRFRNKLMIKSLFATRFSNDLVDGERLLNWLVTQSESQQKVSSLIVATILSAFFYLFLLLFVFLHTSPFLCIVPLLLSFIWYLTTKKEQGNLTEDISYQRMTFGQLLFIFEYLEKYPYAKNSQLKQKCEPFYLHSDRRPSILLQKFEKIVSRATLSRSAEAWAVLNAFIPLGAYTAYQMDKYKALMAQYLPVWMDIWYELEMASSLANFAYLHPEYTFPEIVSEKRAQSSVIFEAKALGHPMIAVENKVSNDFRLDPSGEVLLITGSNMAGKSTFLRTLGVNLCLAFAGSVVNAASLRVSLFEIYACIRVTDSLADGYSYFYAEVRRLKGLLDKLEKGTHYPLFFLIDEIFKGTNNYERLIGSEAYIRALVSKRCAGAISTHDLELVRLSDTLSAIKNYHFREDIVDGHMVFEYLLREGPSPTRNALRIMEMEGLPVKWQTAESSR